MTKIDVSENPQSTSSDDSSDSPVIVVGSAISEFEVGSANNVKIIVNKSDGGSKDGARKEHRIKVVQR